MLLNKKTCIWSIHVTSSKQNRRLRGAGGGKPAALGDFWKFVSISAEIQPKNLKLVHY